MSLIEQLGGYERAKAFLNAASYTMDELIMMQRSGLRPQHVKKALLEYRRQHNIFERNDYVVNKDIKYSDELNIVSASNDKALWFFGKIYGGFVKSQFRHATSEEIAAGKRLEVNQWQQQQALTIGQLEKHRSQPMTEKCVNTGNWIEMCESLTEVTRNQYGDIQSQVMSVRSQNASRLRIVAGRFKKNRVELNFCPFCGVNIETDYKEQSHD